MNKRPVSAPVGVPHRRTATVVASLLALGPVAGWSGDLDDARGWPRGLSGESTWTTDLLGNVAGGVDRGFEAPMVLNASLTYDTGAGGLWSGGTFFVTLQHTNGGKITGSRVGDLQAVSSLEAGDTTRLFEAWYEHTLPGGRARLLVGLHDVNADFYVSDYAGLFVNSSFGIGPDVSQVGPSIFPVSALGARLAVDVGADGYAMAAVYDGIPAIRASTPAPTCASTAATACSRSSRAACRASSTAATTSSASACGTTAPGSTTSPAPRASATAACT